ncbi:MAG TPA: citrate synthase [Longimicrobiales bacterium]
MSSRGLEGVVVADTELSKIYGEEGRLVYRGYEIDDLARNATFEEVCYLLLYGDLPDSARRAEFRAQLERERPVAPAVLDLLRTLPRETHPMAVLRTAASALAAFDPDAESMAEEANLRKAIRLTAQLPTLTAAWDRIRNGREPIAPKEGLGHAANFLYMLTGEEPDELRSRVMDVAFTLHAEHGMNASTFAARVTVATLSDMHSGLTSAIGTLKGPLHGGANERVMKMLLEIGEPERAEEWVRAALARGERIMGFGHRVYRALDPRAPILRELAEQLAAQGGNTRWLDIAARIERVMREEMDRRGKKIYPNVDFYSASVYYTLGIPTDMFTNIFAMARTPGWTAHMIEQLRDNRLIRPKSTYVGPLDRKVKPIEERV